MPSIFQVTAALAAVASSVQAVKLTLNDYEVLKNAVNNPPACGVPYPNVDVARITAMSGIAGNFDPNCGGCINVKGSTGSKHLLVVDSCVGAGLGDHLDISTTAGPDVVGSDTGNHEVTWEWVDVSNCAGIWDGQGMDNVPNGSENWGKLQSLGSGGTPSEQPAQEQPAQEQQPATSAPAPAPVTSAAPAVFAPVSSAPAGQEQPSSVPEPAPAPAPSSSAAAPVVESSVVESSVVAPIAVETPSAVPTSEPVPPEAPTSTAVAPVSPGMFFENNTALSIPSTFATAASTAVTHVPSHVASPTVPAVSPPAFTGAASRSSATLPVLSVFAAVLALWI